MINKLVSYRGVIIKKLPNSMFLVSFILLGKNVVCYLCGKLRLKYIKLTLGDEVMVEFDSSNFNKGRIIKYINEGKGIY